MTPVPPSRFLPGALPRNIAHRGLALDGAENTLRAFAAAISVGADMLETDTWASSDGTAFAVHDPDLRRVAGSAIRVDGTTARDLAEVRVAGEPLPRLEDVLGSFPEVPVNIDVKDRRAVEPAAEAIARTAAAQRVCLTSFDGRTAALAVRAVARRTGVMPVRSPSTGALAALLALLATGASPRLTTPLLRPYGAVQVPRRHRGIPVLTPRLISAAHHAGCEVHVWTIDRPEEMREVLAQGVDGIVTNRSDLLAEVLAR